MFYGCSLSLIILVPIFRKWHGLVSGFWLINSNNQNNFVGRWPGEFLPFSCPLVWKLSIKRRALALPFAASYWYFYSRYYVQWSQYNTIKAIWAFDHGWCIKLQVLKFKWRPSLKPLNTFLYAIATTFCWILMIHALFKAETWLVVVSWPWLLGLATALEKWVKALLFV